MKCTIPEISWHNREPVLSFDIFPKSRDFYRLVSGGGDCHVLIWQMTITESGAVNQEVISDLTRHQRAVNCVRWSTSGKYLASGDDDANIIIWQLKTDNIPLLEGDTDDKETWIVYKVMRGHKEDVYDLCWAIDESKILSGSVDNTAILWDVHKGKMDHILTDHKGFVQGVSWDPKNQIIATISTDRMCRIFDPLGKQVKARIHKGKLQVPDEHHLKDKEVKFFHDDTFKSFFRRLNFTPDGSLLIVPSGHIESDNCKDVLNATLIFTLDNFISPAVILPLPRQSSTVVRCCPILFELHEDGPEPIIKLPYRMIFAVGTDHDILLYDTQQTVPFARFQDIHYTRLTDLTWSPDGLLLIGSSTDGFCGIITFEMDELGVPWVKLDSEEEENPMDISGCEELEAKDENIDTNNKDITAVESNSKVKDEPKKETKKRPSFLEQWALKTPKRKKVNTEENKSTNKKENENKVIEILDSPESVNGKDDPKSTEDNRKEVPVNRLIPRRKTLLTKDKEDVKEIPFTNDVRNENCKPEKVNILVPKRIKPQIIDSKPSTSKEENASCSKKRQLSENAEIEVSENRRASDDEDISDSEDEEEKLSKEELEDLHKASENIKEFFCKMPKKQDVSKDNINVIVPRRKPRVTDSTDNSEATKQKEKAIVTVHKHSDAKPIEVRRKPREQGIDQGKDSQSEQYKAVVGSDKKHLDAKPIEVRRKPREQSIDHGKDLKSEDNKAVVGLDENLLDATPIEVRRKPREQGIDQEKDLQSEHNKAVVGSDKKYSDAKPIKVRRKPREQGIDNGKDSKNKDNKAVVSSDKKHSEAKPTAVTKKARDSIEKKTVSSAKLDKKEEANKKTEVSDSDNVAVQNKQKSEDVVCIIDSDDEYNTTPTKSKLDLSKTFKKDPENKPPKIKVSSLVKRKSVDTTPKKTNSLLNFLQKSAEKKTKKKKEDKDEVHIDLSLEENEARDAWKCDNKPDIKNSKDEKNIKVVLVDDDKTEDFSLQLEDSQEAEDEINKRTESQLSEEPNANKSSSQSKSVNVEETSNSSVPKTPRRISLITLASPKGKTKRKE